MAKTLSIHIENITKSTFQCLRIKTTMLDLKVTKVRTNIRLDRTEEKMSELKL